LLGLSGGAAGVASAVSGQSVQHRETDQLPAVWQVLSRPAPTP
jgi:hypothetical protein